MYDKHEEQVNSISIRLDKLLDLFSATVHTGSEVAANKMEILDRDLQCVHEAIQFMEDGVLDTFAVEEERTGIKTKFDTLMDEISMLKIRRNHDC